MKIKANMKENLLLLSLEAQSREKTYRTSHQDNLQSQPVRREKIG
jgi:hypothetical protein